MLQCLLHRFVVAIAVLFFGCGAALAQQEKRIALLIGNQAYDSSVGALKNPHNDVALVAEALRKQGFEILPLVKDARRSAILAAVRDLAGKLRTAGPLATGFLYYSGHGAAEKDTNVNYVIPVDARNPASAGFWDESVKLDDIVKLLDTARNATKFVVFDACRNELQLPTRDASKGLVPVAEQQGYFIAYASAPGRTASDAGDTSGPYAAALARELGRQGLDHLNLFQNVKETVIAATGGVQHPWESNGLSRRIYLTGEPTMPADIKLWESVRGSNDPAQLQRYLEAFPTGVFAATARQIMSRLETTARDQQELRKATEEARIARDALAAAETRRIAAEKAAEAAKLAATPAPRESAEVERKAAAALAQAADLASEAAKTTRSALSVAEKRMKAAEQRLAMLEQSGNSASSPKPSSKPAPGPFDGVWQFELTRNRHCGQTSNVTFAWEIQGNVVFAARGGRANINASGEFEMKWPHRDRPSLFQYMKAKLVGDIGKGTWYLDNGNKNVCGGNVTWTRQRS